MLESKKSLRRRLDFYLGKCEQAKEANKTFKAIHEINMNSLEKQTDQINELLKVNKQLELDLDTEMRQKEKLAELLAIERGALCPADCKNRKNRVVCRLCTRYPALRDRYEVES